MAFCERPTNTNAQKAGTSRSTLEMSRSDPSGAGAKWYPHYQKQRLKLEESLKKAHNIPKSSLSTPRKREAAEISPHEGNVPKNLQT